MSTAEIHQAELGSKMLFAGWLNYTCGLWCMKVIYTLSRETYHFQAFMCMGVLETSFQVDRRSPSPERFAYSMYLGMYILILYKQPR